MNSVELNKNKVIDLLLYLKLMISFDLNVQNEHDLQSEMTGMWDGIKNKKYSASELENKVSYLMSIATPFVKKYPLQVEFSELTKEIYDIHLERNDSLNEYGIQAGWLRERMDISNYLAINDYPYQTYFGYGAKKGGFGVEEHFLLIDAFKILSKSKLYYDKFISIGENHRKKIGDSDLKFLDQRSPAYEFEIACYSRVSILSFFSFLESFVNSIGYNYLKCNESELDDSSINILKGLNRNGKGYTNIRKRIEMFQSVIQPDKKIVLKLTDDNQIKDPFSTLFKNYTDLRDSSMHSSPFKENIWLSTSEWQDKASELAVLTMEASKLIWKTLVNPNQLPEYLESLDYDKLLSGANEHLKSVDEFYSFELEGTQVDS